MFELKGKYLTSHYYARQIPLLSLKIYEMSHVKESSFFYKTIPFPTRLISLESDFTNGYTKRLRKYIRNADSMGLKLRRPERILDIMNIYQSVLDSKNFKSIHPDHLEPQDNYYYSEVHHPDLGRVAAHVSIGDREEQVVFGMINASDFRAYDSKENQRICSIANKYLFHQDMLYFQSLGYHDYDMVGVSEPMNQMKKEFGGEIVMTYTHVPYVWYVLQKVKDRWKNFT